MKYHITVDVPDELVELLRGGRPAADPVTLAALEAARPILERALERGLVPWADASDRVALDLVVAAIRHIKGGPS